MSEFPWNSNSLVALPLSIVVNEEIESFRFEDEDDLEYEF